MPPWVSRQWHVLRAARAVANTVCGLQRHAKPACVPTLRSYAQKSSQKAPRAPGTSTPNSAIIVPSSVSVTPEDLIHHIKPISKQLFTKDHRFAVFFLTPAFATWLLDDRTFVHKALSQLYQEFIKTTRSPDVEIHALCAVVDKLPTPQYIENFSQIKHVGAIKDTALRRTRAPPTWDVGHEGMAYTTLRFSDSVQSPQPAADAGGSISFLTSEGSEKEGFYGNTLRLPLANTVFQTGSPTTMTHSTWKRVKETRELTLESKENLTHHGIRLYRQKSTSASASAIAIPLVPLCFPRIVEASMGNILRQISKPGQTEPMPASQELESLVPQYHKSRGEPPQAISVWALLIPKETLRFVLRETRRILKGTHGKNGIDDSSPTSDVWEALWKNNPTIWSELVPLALTKGARLHRVLSGGGGWGKKAGLLSLDPAVTSTESESSTSQKFSDRLDGPGDLSSALHPVAHPGDSIQFFVSPKAPSGYAGDSNAITGKLKELTSLPAPWRWELGTIPSTIDSIQASSWQHDASESKDMFVFRNSFGALAEGGMYLKRQFHLEMRDSLSVVGGTKVDVPFSRFSSVDFVVDKKGAVGSPTLRIRRIYKDKNEEVGSPTLKIKRIYK
ncbi:hypothetical protein K505DRAFT_328217 [Melanomma pulvis-pyrius CBS 109.77]|uniref:Uncharacterized protein n=1 Tax=Melanomma pulvis-pyrius CBS 109.77 TaxID=1314802 RepID=A0A6A6WZG6_9PLEO|nr:hypothetical protein K505DRAFT_328217 [Melanomma pulvis-pyrius CBS 109.77]